MSNKIRLPDLKRIEIKDPLFGHYSELVGDTMLAVQYDILSGKREDCGCRCIDNFKLAAGFTEGEYHGVVFGDTDAYKWIEAVAYCANNGHEEFIKKADSLIDLIASAQQSDGYLNTYYTVVHPELRWSNLVEGHELFSAGHLIEAAVAYFEATGKRKLLDVACRFADLICEHFGSKEGQCKGYPGHQEIELALIKLWRVTGENRYLRASEYFISQRGTNPNYFLDELKGRNNEVIFPEFADYDLSYSQSHTSPATQTEAEGHAVRAMYMYSAMADLARELPDETLKAACESLWASVTEKRMYITGGIGSSGVLERFTVDYDLPNDRMYCESCAGIGLMMFGQRMSALNRDASYYEVVERVLYNTVLAGISAAGDRYFYVNPLEVWPENCMEHSALAYVKSERQPWFDVACCPPNIARTLASLGQYIFAVDDKSLYINLLISSRFETEIQGNRVSVEIDNGLVQGKTLRLHICSSGEKPMTVRLRVPSWLREPSFAIDGVQIRPAIENGYAVLAVNRQGEQELEISGIVRAHFMCANLSVRADIGKIAVVKGPFVYCLEQTDNGENLAALSVTLDARIDEAKPLSDLPGKLPTLRIDGERLVNSIKDPTALYAEPDLKREKAELTAIPYCLWGNRRPGEMRVWIDAVRR